MFRTIPLLLTAALLAGCTRTAPLPTDAQAHTTVLTVTSPDPTLSDAQLEQRYGAKLITRTATFAVLTTSRSGLRAQNAGVSAQPDHVIRSPLRAAGSVNLWGEGSVGLWGEGSVSLWGDGSVALWGDGHSSAETANHDTWQALGLSAAHTRQPTAGANTTTTIAVLDTGLDLDHPMFQASLSPRSTWKDFVDHDATPHDEGEFGSGLTGHGTEVAGLALIVAPHATLMPIRVLDETGRGDASAVAAGIVWAADHGADIINLSLGADQPVDAITEAVAYANSRGVIITASAGNNGNEGLDYPAAQFAGSALNLAVGSHDGAGVKSAFSQYGALSVTAPGEGLFGPAPQRRLAAWSGTSMSAPIAAGSAALTLGLTGAPAAAVARLTTTARNTDTLNHASLQGKLGAGALDLDAATRPD